MIKRSDIKYRVGTFKAKSKVFATFLVYIDARTTMDELDENFGKTGWKFKWKRVEGQDWAVKGYLSIKDGDEWLTREDVGYPQGEKKKSDINGTEWLKDAVSDALKRCGVQWGVGRFLYDAPFLYTEELNTYQDTKGVVHLNSYNPLTDLGKQMIEGNIDKWYKSVSAKLADK